MTVDSTADLLNKTEKSLLLSVSESPKYISEVSSATGVDKTALSNAARKLLGLDLVRISNEITISYQLSPLGKKYVKQNLPEITLINMVKNSAKMGDLKNAPLEKQELSAAFGYLKKSGVIDVINGEIILNMDKIGKINSKNDLLKSISNKEVPSDTEDLNDFIKRKIIEKSESIAERIEITAEGVKVIKSPNFGRNLVDKLTPETIKSWKGLEFREYDLSARPPIPLSGKRNIAKQFISNVKDTLVAMGFKEMQSNYAESSFWNFDVMMFKQEHPDRDIQDTVYINAPEPVVQKNILERVKQVYESGFKTARNNKSIGYARKFDDKKSRVLIMRGHTTATTFRYINEFISKNKDSPAKYFSLSKVFRNETMDQTHLPEFYQVEGIVYDDNLNVSHLIGYIKEFYGRIGMDQIRLKPTYNPYTEPSLEIQAFSSKLNKWIEVGNSGVFRPETLEPFGIKKNIVAWGFGFDRILLLKLGLADVRLLYGGFADLDVLRNVEARKLFDRMG
ncbi:MAG: phenylalanine--tRNA ligase subunit alpha [Candidatus Parvarchaeota archaeon]|nr:phenylalanine--tRNA ligase subunit alpha [Candidatus Parvarchaeota archaeon]MCL5101037.1 phenylalanine--tRNA ligase subunit alpha [Candidatus Parvarchaeota archaeon]